MKRRGRSTLQITLLILVIFLLTFYEVEKLTASSKTAVEIVFVYGSEKQGWIEEVIPEFENWWFKVYGFKIKVKCIPMGSGESMNQIMHRQLTPTVWSPASSLWIPLANYLWEKLYPEEVREKGPLISDWTPLVYSPIVIITWESFRKEYNISSFEDLHGLAVSEIGYKLKFAHTDPTLSNSGFMTLVLEVSVAAGKPPQKLTVEDLTKEDVKKWLRELESKAVFYGRSTGFLIEQAVASGPERMNVIIAYENLVIDKNIAGDPEARWGQKLVAVYPAEGTLLSDHPYCILNAPWVKEEQKKIAKELLKFLLEEDIQAKSMKHGFRPTNEKVELDEFIFNSELGVEKEVKCEILNSNVSGEVLWRIFDLWPVVKARG